MSRLVILFTSLLLALSCKVEEAANYNENSTSVKNRSAAKAVVTSVKVRDGKLEIIGSSLSGVTKVKIQSGQREETFSLESVSSSKIVAAGLRNFSFVAEKAFSLILADAYGSSTFQIQFTLKDKQVTGNMLHDMGASDGDVLVYNQLSDIWEARPVSGLTLRGAWNANLNEPTLSDGGYATSPMKGDYYVVSHTGDANIDGISTWEAGNWILFNGSRWERIANASAAQTFNGRKGLVVPEEGDYELELLGDVQTSGAQVGHVLKFDGTQWIPAPDASADNVESMGSEQIANGSLTNEDISSSAEIDQSKISGLTTSLASISNSVSSNSTDIANNASAISTNASALSGKAPLPASACTGTDKLVWNGSSFACAADYDTNTDTSAATTCSAGQYLDGDGTCKTASNGDLLSDGSVAMAADFNLAGNTLTNLSGLNVATGNFRIGPDIGQGLGSLSGIAKITDTTNDKLVFSLFNATNHDTTSNGGVTIEMLGRRSAGPYSERVPMSEISSIPEAASFSSSANRRSSLVFRTFKEDAGGMTEKMRITSDGKVGIGTSTPSTTLDAVGSSFKFTGTGAASTSLHLTPQSSNIFKLSATNMHISGGNSVAMEARALDFNVNVGHNPISFKTQGTTRLHVGDANSGGFVGIGTTSPTERLEVAGCIKHSNGTIGSGCSSDRRLKDDIEDVDFGGEALSKFLSLRPRTYVYKSDPAASFYGFIAQEALDVDEDMVSKRKDGYFTVDYERAKWLHFKASQEMGRKIASLESENARLHEDLKRKSKQIEELKNRMEKIEASIEALTRD